MRFKTPLANIVSFCALAGAALLGVSGCASTARDPRAAEAPAAESTALDELYRSHPHLTILERKLDRASAHFYFGESELAESTARDLIREIDDLRSTRPDAELCDHFDYLENRAMTLLQRLADDEIESHAVPHVAAVIDSLARSTVVEEEIEITFNEKTNHWIAYFQGSGRRHFEKWLARVGEHRVVIEPILVEVGIPRDILYLAVIESGLNLSARSYAKAVGPWQFMAGTAQLFGLRVNWWIDERKDLVASTYAAANYLKYLYDVFGSWPLALAAYNAGEHRVARAIIRQRTTDYWRLDLPAQTEWFVPKYMAALAIGRNPEAYGYEQPVELPLSFDIIEVDRPVELRAIADAADFSLAQFKALNPHFKRWCTPPDMVVEVKVPRGSGIAAAERLAAMKAQSVTTILQHRVKRGETLSSIAAQYEVSVKDLKRANEMGKSNMIRAGNILLVPVKDLQRSPRLASRPSYRAPERPPSKAAIPLLTAPDGERAIRYVVKKHDSLVKIAERFNTRLGDLRDWNDLNQEARIAPGDTLIIRLAQAHSPGPHLRAGALAADGKSAATDAAVSGDPAAAGGDMRWIVHVVQKGDTLSSISRRYNARLSDVLAWNNKTKRSTLYPGDKIKIRVGSN